MQSYIKQGDCLELMKEIPDNSVDLILCDLPYGTTQNKWDTVLDLEKLWEGYNRIAKDNTPIVLFSQMPFTTTLVNSNLPNFKYEWIWQKQKGTGYLNAKKMPLKAHENILVFYKKLPLYNPQMRTGFKSYSYKNGKNSNNYHGHSRVITTSNGERYPIDILEFSRDDKQKLHPTQKPVALLEYLIKTYTNEGATVLDNCMGSGSTCVACINTNRNYIGFELNETYFNIAKERLKMY